VTAGTYVSSLLVIRLLRRSREVVRSMLFSLVVVTLVLKSIHGVIRVCEAYGDLFLPPEVCENGILTSCDEHERIVVSVVYCSY
jgi:hypothetical protein